MFSFDLRSSTIRLGIVISSLVIATIVVFQLVWLKKTYHYEQKEFNHSIVKAVRGLYEDLEISAYNSNHLSELIGNRGPDLFLVRINASVNKDSLLAYLQYELEDFGVFTECHLGMYHADSGRYIYTRLVPASDSAPQNEVIVPDTPASYDHLSLYFPNREKYIISQMNSWIISSAILLLVLLLFAGSLYYFFRQKFLNETQRDFIHNFTHEFKTPVAVISLAADVLKDPGIAGRPDKLVTYAGIVEYQSNYLRNQIERLLRFAHTDSRHLHLSLEKVDLHELIREAVKNLGPLINEKKANLSLELKAADPCLVADRDYLVIVVTNLIDNAIKYARQPQVVVRTETNDRFTRLSVSDNGIGIDKKQIKKIFRKFFRGGKGETYAAKGFGLGLSFVRKIVVAHHGRISVESQPGDGSVFTIEIPKVQ